MKRYVALLRGINVGGHAKVAMADLRTVFESLGFDDVATYIQSGNVVFGSAAPVDVRAVEQRIADDLGVTPDVLLRTAEEIDAVVRGNPFADTDGLHVTFLADTPTGTVEAPAGQPDELAVVGREAYVRCPDGYGRTKLNNTFLEKRLGVPATTRNWKTVVTLAEMARR
ncbi:MAG TPA: DUF1697 domain-containing protein [Mycobacteriales bacterium]|nr:DUF1697 domain-containing protein [Mycobacteriales bacterium]